MNSSFQDYGSFQGQLRGGGPRVRDHPAGPDHHEVRDREDGDGRPLQGAGEPQHLHRAEHQHRQRGLGHPVHEVRGMSVMMTSVTS